MGVLYQKKTIRGVVVRSHKRLPVRSYKKLGKIAYSLKPKFSGVVHAGIYYVPGSLKAKLCVKGMKLMYDYCDEHNIPYKMVGKLIVATEEEELPRLDALWDRAIENGCTVNMVDTAGIKEIEPHCVGLRAIHSPLTGKCGARL